VNVLSSVEVLQAEVAALRERVNLITSTLEAFNTPDDAWGKTYPFSGVFDLPLESVDPLG
jgi:hypothetical protein